MTKKYLLLLLLITSIANLHAQSWVPHSSGSTSLVTRISFPVSDTGYLINDVGQIKKTVNGDVSWTNLTAPASAGFLMDIHFITPSTGVLAGGQKLYRTTNGGSSWINTFTLPDSGYFNYFQFPDAMNGFITSTNANIDSLRFYSTTDGGVTWNFVSAIQSWNPVYAPVFFHDANNGFYAAEETIGMSTDGAQNFTSVYSGSVGDFIQPLTFANVDTGYCTYQMGNTVRTVDGGLTWSAVGNPGAIVYDLHFIDGKNGFACGGDGFSTGWVMKTADAGFTWQIDYQSTYSYNCFSFPNDSVGYSGGQGGYVLKHSSSTSGINEMDPPGFDLFPNPATDFVLLRNLPVESSISLVDITGQSVLNQKADPSTGSGSEVMLDTHTYAAGIYFVVVSNPETHYSRKVVITR